MATLFSKSQRAKAIWLNCLASALRIALACIIVGCTTLFGPASLQHQIAFPAFSYVTVILIVTDATLGDTLRGCWLVLYASFQSLGPSILSFWLIGPARFSSGTTALAVALGAFVVVLPEKTHLVAKRIALGQIVIVYVIAFIKGLHTEPVMHPIRVAASTANGGLACVLSMLVPLPLPSLACLEVKHNCKLHVENATERLRHLVKAFCAEDNTSALESITQSKYLASTATTFLQSVKRYRDSMKWEKIPLKFLKPKCKGDRMQDIEVALRGMEIALISIPSFPVRHLNQELKDSLFSLQNHINTIILDDSLTVDSESISNEKKIKFLHTLKTIPQTQQDLPSFFFFFCTKLLHTKLWAKTSVQENKIPQKEESIDSYKQNGFCFKEMWNAFSWQLNNQRLIAASKFSVSLGFAVLFGLIYSKENGYWAGLPIAISFASAREATFRVANVKAQGTVLGTVYGVLGCFVFERLLAIRFLSLLPWFILTSFLRRSRMYGQAGGISAVIGALLILGRKNFGPPSEFAIARIIETFIGLSCSVLVDLLFQPTRATTLAKSQLSKSLSALQDCINSMSLQTNKMFLKDNQKRLRVYVNDLKKFIEEAEAEPNFWFLPFHNACYVKLLNSLSKMMDVLLFSAEALGFLQQQSLRLEADWKHIVNIIDGDLECFKKLIGSSVKCFEEVTIIESLKTLERELKKNEICCDLEQGKLRNPGNYAVSSLDGEEIDNIINCYLQHSKEVADKMNLDDREEETKSQVVISLCALGFCISSMLRETREIEKEIQELIQLDNPSKPIRLYEISYMIHALQK